MITDINVNLNSAKNLFENLDYFSVSVRKKMLRKAMKETCAPIEADAKSRVNDDLGILSDAIQTSVSVTDKKTVGYVGIRRGVQVPVRVVRRGKNKGKMLVSVPSRYANQVERGHLIVSSSGKVVGRVAAKPFMRPAWDSYGGENAFYTFADSMSEQIDEEIQQGAYLKPTVP